MKATLFEFNQPQLDAVAIIFKPGLPLPNGKVVNETVAFCAKIQPDGTWAWNNMKPGEREAITAAWIEKGSKIDTWYWCKLN